MAEWLTTREAADRLRSELGVTSSARYLRDSAKKGRVPGYELDGTWWVDYEVIHRRFAEAIRKALDK